jgi:hypothetical protein
MATLLPVGHLNLKNKVNIKQSKKNEYPKQVATPHIMHAAAMTTTVHHSHARTLNTPFVHMSMFSAHYTAHNRRPPRGFLNE